MWLKKLNDDEVRILIRRRTSKNNQDGVGYNISQKILTIKGGQFDEYKNYNFFSCCNNHFEKVSDFDSINNFFFHNDQECNQLLNFYELLHKYQKSINNKNKKDELFLIKLVFENKNNFLSLTDCHNDDGNLVTFENVINANSGIKNQLFILIKETYDNKYWETKINDLKKNNRI